MEFCKYHPIETAIYHCNICQSFHCDSCVKNDAQYPTCYLCSKEVSPLIVSNNITPFWRRLDESFKYPLNFDALFFIAGLSILSTVATYMPFYFIWFLILMGALFKYSFSCLTNTSHGNMTAPEVTDAYGEGFGLILQLIALVVILVVILWLTELAVGTMVATVLGILFIIAFPAMVINFALTENILEALNPISVSRLITSIGLPYGLLLAFIMIMTASVGVIQQFIASDLSFISITLQSIVSNYYTIVIFHIMGYMIYQFQTEIGFDSQFSGDEDDSNKSVLQKMLIHIDILIKEGEYEAAIELFREMVKSYPDEKSLKSQFFELILISKNAQELDDFTDQYLNYLKQESRQDQIPLIYKRVLQVNPNFMPKTAQQRVALARICDQKGDAKLVVKLINGLHKEFADFEGLVDAYLMMANSLDGLPNMQNQAQKCRLFVDKLRVG